MTLKEDRVQYHKDMYHPSIGYASRRIELEKKYTKLGMLDKLQAPYEVELNPKNPKLQERGEMKFYNHMGTTWDNVQEITPEREAIEDKWCAENYELFNK